MPAIASSARQAEAALAARGVGVAGYLARLGLEDAGVPSAAALADLHARHLDRIAYENLEIQLGWPTTVDFAESAERIVRHGRGGYCFHLNGAFGLLLEALGYTVARRRGTVQPAPDAEPGTGLNHLVLYVHGLPSDEHPEGTWWADVGLSDGFARPLPLRAGRWDDGPYAYGLSPSPAYAGGWRLLQEPAGAFTVVDVDVAEPTAAELAASHRRLSTWPDSGFVGTATVFRRDAAGVDILRDCTLTRIDGAGTRRTLLTDPDAWFDALTDLFGLGLDDIVPDERRALWERVRAQHEAWAAEQAG